MSSTTNTSSSPTFFDAGQLLHNLPQAVRKLDPREVVHAGDVRGLGGRATHYGPRRSRPLRLRLVSCRLAVGDCSLGTLAEAVAEGRGRAQAQSLRRARKDATARRLHPDGQEARPGHTSDSAITWSSKPARSSPATAMWWRVWHLSTSPRSLGNPLP